MRVLHVLKATGIGGAERHLATLLPALEGAGIQQRPVLMVGGDGLRFERELERQGLQPVVINAGPDLNPLALFHVRQQIRDSRADLVHTHLIHGDVYGQIAARSLGVPAIATVHGVHIHAGGRATRLVAREALRSARCVLAISEHVARSLVGAGVVPGSKVAVVPYGVPHPEVSTGAGEARSSLGVDSTAVLVVMISRLIENKGHEWALRAFAEAQRTAPTLQLVIAGDGPLRASLQETALSLGLYPNAVRFQGFVENVSPLLRACDIVLVPTLPALDEGFGLAALEGSVHGRPVVVSNLPALSEVVESGRTGVVVTAGDVAALAEAIGSLARDQDYRERLGEAGARRAGSQFSVQAMVERTAAAYRGAVADSA